MMNASLKAAAAPVAEGSRSKLFQLRAALFHSTTILERRRRNPWQSPNNPWPAERANNSRRSRKQLNRWKRSFENRFNSFAEEFFKSQTSERDDPSRSWGPSWSGGQHRTGGSRGHANPYQFHKATGRRAFEFCYYDDDTDTDDETMFRSGFNEEKIPFWSFVNQRKRQRGYSPYTAGSFWHYKLDSDDDDEYTYFHDDEEEVPFSRTSNSVSTSSSDRLVLGLSPRGPLKMDDVKHAYRACALKYHPDRHQGPTKNAAEEKFKLCTAAYESICEKMAVG